VTTVVVVGVVAYFFAVALSENWNEVVAAQLSFSWWWVAAGVLFAAAVPLTGILWRRVLIALAPEAEISHPEAIAVQCASWLLKYVPGQVGAVLNKVVWAAKKQISRMLVVVTFVYENLFLVFASFVPSLIILAAVVGFEVIGRNAATLLLPALALLPLSLLAYKPFFHRIMSLLLRRAIKQDVPERFFLRTSLVLRFTGEFLGPRVLNGIGFVLIAGTVVDLTPPQWLAFGAAYVLGGAIGLLAIGVPSGLGVREAVIVIILSQFVSVAEAIVIALLARLISTLSDGLVALLYAVIRRTVPKEFRP
jgi:uncharacterized membrane protein YbhN (UPF0104 family)